MAQIAIIVFLFVAISIVSWLFVGVTARRTWMELCMVFAGTFGGMVVGCLVFESLQSASPLVFIALLVSGCYTGGRQARRLAIRWQRPWWR